LKTERVVMKRNLLAGILAAMVIYAMTGVMALAGADATRRKTIPLGRYACVPASESSPMPDLKLLTIDKYEGMGKTGIYVYETGSRRIEWLSGSIPKQQVGIFVPKGVDNAAYDTIIIRNKRDVDEGIERDLWKCSLAE
jgi:hypothetical protein